MSWLFPEKQKFFQQLDGIVARLTSVASLLEQALDKPARLPELLLQIDRLQLETDQAAREIDFHVEKQFIPPMDREDIHLLSTRLRLVADFIAGTARRAVSLHATSRQEPAVALAQIIVRAVREIESAVNQIRLSNEVLARCREIKRAEEEGDAVWESAVTRLFAGTSDPIDVIRWKTIYDHLEDTLDACEDVANELETITIKHM